MCKRRGWHITKALDTLPVQVTGPWRDARASLTHEAPTE